MNEFDEWASNGGLDVKRFPMSSVYKNTDTRVASAAWDFQQAKIDDLQHQLDCCREENKGLLKLANEPKASQSDFFENRPQPPKHDIKW